MKRVKQIGLVLISLVLGFVAATWLRNAAAKPTEPAFMVGVNGVDVHRFADVYEGGVIHCYVAHDRSNSAENNAAISCVKR
jgi:hypothetical protein